MNIRRLITFIHLLLICLCLFALNTQMVLGIEFLSFYLFVVVLTLIYFFVETNYLVFAYTVGFSAVLVTSVLVIIMRDNLFFNGWILEELLKPQLTNQANIAIMVGISSFCIGGIIFNKNHKILFNKNLPALEAPMVRAKNMVSVGSFLLGIFFSYSAGGSSLAEGAYSGNATEQAFGSESSSVSYILGIVFTAVSFYLAYHGSSFKKAFVKIIFLGLLLSMLYFNVYKGDRDGLLTYVIVLLGCYWIYSTTKLWKKISFILVSGIIMYFVLLILGSARSQVADKGIVGAFSDAQIIRGGNELGFSPTKDLDLLPIMYWQTLGVSRLINEDNYFYLKSYKNLIPQSLPTPIANILGIQRPENSAWELGKFHNHGGGFFLIAEFYWNGGIIVVIISSFLLAWMLMVIERWFFKQNRFLLAFYFGLIASFPTCVYYSIQGMFRWVEVWFLFAIFYKMCILLIAYYFKRTSTNYILNDSNNLV